MNRYYKFPKHVCIIIQIEAVWHLHNEGTSLVQVKILCIIRCFALLMILLYLTRPSDDAQRASDHRVSINAMVITAHSA